MSLTIATTATTMPEQQTITKNGHLVQVDSIYRLIILAGLRSKQLVRGSQPRIEADPTRRKNTSIALEEIRQGLVGFKIVQKDATEKKASPAEFLDRY